ncbi:MAG: 4Fe-4S cluster-binding domain-containing protein [Actinomycetota bacterium]|uniref:4Fe-4S cluster-binding domain-containing protein n=1 Tax=Hydrogenophaga sp. TaxID=1904254 RepID=UPI00286DC872|nr:4Fe-4S cluster-binding domain-containing protein [Hydrogenophaga sp.]
MTVFNLNKAHYPVTVLGRGRRIGIWFQGCSIHCTGCVSQDTWDHHGGARIAVDDLLEWCKAVSASDRLDGITLSGGEPFEQPDALLALLEQLVLWRRQQSLDFDILCYSGFPYRRLAEQFSQHLKLIDILCPEPYVGKLASPLLWRGSPNQPLLDMTKRGTQALVGLESTASTRGFQVDVRDGRIWFIGIPDRGDMARMEALVHSRGMSLRGVSWNL